MKKRLIDVYAVESTVRPLMFLKTIKRYSLKYLKDDLLAGFSVALLAIPQSIAYSLLAGLPPQAGIFTAIFGSIFTGMFGSSKHLVAGPSTGVSILIQTIIANLMFTHFPDATGVLKDQIVLQLLMLIVFVVGIIQLLFVFFNLGKILQFVSRSVILGYFAGVGIVIVVNQLFYFFGIKAVIFTNSTFFKAVFLVKQLVFVNWIAFFLGIFSVLLLLFVKWKFKKLPNALIMIAIVTLFGFFLKRANVDIPVLTDLGMREMPGMKLILPFMNFKYFKIILFPALAISLLSILEVTSISKGIAARSGQKIRSNQEIFGVGVANFVLSFFSSAMPSSGSVSRTTLNYQNGARTRFASVFNGIFIALLIFFFWPLIKFVPLCALAAILIVMAISVVEIRHVKLCFRATKGDGFVFLLTMGSCLFLRLDIAFFIGIIISIVFFLHRAAVPHLVEYTFDEKKRLVVVAPKRHVHRKIRIIGIAGELFFAAVDLVQNTLQKIMKEPSVKVVILRLKNIYHVDASICLSILKLNDYLKSTNRNLLISGVTEEVYEIFRKSGIVKQLGEDKIFLTEETKPMISTWKALTKAKELIE